MPFKFSKWLLVPILKQKEAERTVPSESIEDPTDPGEGCSRRRKADDDPSWEQPDANKKTMPEMITLTLEQKTWIERMIPVLDLCHLSHDQAFLILSQFLVTNGVDLKNVILSPTTIRDIREKVHLHKEETKVNIFPTFPLFWLYYVEKSFTINK